MDSPLALAAKYPASPALRWLGSERDDAVAAKKVNLFTRVRPVSDDVDDREQVPKKRKVNLFMRGPIQSTKSAGNGCKSASPPFTSVYFVESETGYSGIVQWQGANGFEVNLKMMEVTDAELKSWILWFTEAIKPNFPTPRPTGYKIRIDVSNNKVGDQGCESLVSHHALAVRLWGCQYNRGAVAWGWWTVRGI